MPHLYHEDLFGMIPVILHELSTLLIHITLISYRYTRHIFRTSLKRPFEETDIFETLNEHKSAKIGEQFSILWERELEKPKPLLLRVLFKAYGFGVLLSGFLFAVTEIMCRSITIHLIFCVFIIAISIIQSGRSAMSGRARFLFLGS